MSGDWRARLESVARVPLAEYPTPLEELPSLSRECGRRLLLKRDDRIGPALGGNKTRKLEFLLAEARETGARRVVTFGGLQSNHAILTAAAARRLGIEPHLLYFERRPPRLTGNLVLAGLLGAQLHFVPLGKGQRPVKLETAVRLARLVARVRVGSHYFIPVGGHSWRGCLGYVRAALEIEAQARALAIGDAWLVVAAGSGGTLAGLMAGLSLAGSSLRPLGIDVGKLWKGFPDSIARLATEMCARLGEPRSFSPEQTPLIEGSFVGPSYGVPSEGGLAATRRLAQAEGVLLDPVYTAKAFAGLLDLVQKGRLGTHEPIIFLHTGGLPALFAFEDLPVQRSPSAG